MIIVSLFFTVLTIVATIITTTVMGGACVIAAMAGVKDKAGSIFDHTPRVWSRLLLMTAGVRVVLHNPERAWGQGAQVYVSNHMSWFDIPTLSASLPRYKFVAKAELFKVPMFGPGIRAIGMVPIQRENRKAAFGAYDEAAAKIKEGNSVVVFPEGTRGTDYPLRPFKKGPFVLAIAAGVPIVPVLTYGTREVLPRGSFLITPTTVHIHLLEPISVEGLDYSSRSKLAERVRTRIADALAANYGIESVRQATPGTDVRDEIQPSPSQS